MYDTQIPDFTNLSQVLVISTTLICLEAEKKNTELFGQCGMARFVT